MAEGRILRVAAAALERADAGDADEAAAILRQIVKLDGTEATNAPVLDYDHIPIERSWAVSMLLHGELGHQGSWEVCEDGCDQLGDRVIRALFGRDRG